MKKEEKKKLVQKAIKMCMEQNHELFKKLAKEEENENVKLHNR